MSYQFKWSVLWSGQSASWLLQGLITTLELSALAWLLAVFLGILSGALRTVAFKPLRAIVRSDPGRHPRDPAHAVRGVAGDRPVGRPSVPADHPAHRAPAHRAAD